MLKSKSMPGKPRPLSLPVLLWWRMLLSSFTLSHRFSFLYLKNSNLHWHKKKLRKIISIAVFAVGGLSSHSPVFLPPHSLALSSHLRVSCHGDKKLLTAPAPFPFPGSIFFCVHFWMAVHATIYFSFSASNLFLCCLLFYRKCRRLLAMVSSGLSSSVLSPLLQVHVCKTCWNWGYWGLNPGPCARSKCSPLNHILGIFFFSVLKQGLSWNFLCSSSCPWTCNPLLLQPLRNPEL